MAPGSLTATAASTAMPETTSFQAHPSELAWCDVFSGMAVEMAVEMAVLGTSAPTVADRPAAQNKLYAKQL